MNIFNILEIALSISIVIVLCCDWIYRHRKSKLKDVRNYIYSANMSLIDILKREILIEDVGIAFSNVKDRKSVESKKIYEYCQFIKKNNSCSQNEKVLMELIESLLVTQISEGLLTALEKKSETDIVVNQALDMSKISEIKGIYSELWKEGIEVVESEDIEKIKNFKDDHVYIDKLTPYKDYIFEINEKLELLSRKYGKSIVERHR